MITHPFHLSMGAAGNSPHTLYGPEHELSFKNYGSEQTWPSLAS